MIKADKPIGNGHPTEKGGKRLRSGVTHATPLRHPMLLRLKVSLVPQSAQPQLEHGSAYRPIRATTAYGRYHHLRDVAGQPVDAPRPLDSCIVMRWCEGTWGALRYLDLLRIRLSLRLSLRHPVAGASLGKDAGRVLRALPDLRRSLTRWVRSVRISPDSSGPPDPLQQMVVVHTRPGLVDSSTGIWYQEESPGIRNTCGGNHSDSIFAVHKRHEILRYSWAVDLKPSRSQTTPFVRGAIVIEEDPSFRPSASGSRREAR